MIPKIIHYCWFGRGEIPELAVKCMGSWKQVLPEYKIKEWNEDNFNLDMFPYVREAYNKGKYAFVSDVARLYALYTEGGIYMDTDVEVLKPLDPFLHHAAFLGFEDEENLATAIIATEKGSRWAKENLDYYQNRHFLKPDGSPDTTTNVVTITNYMIPHGLKRNNTYQDFPGLITFYPKDYFCPKDNITEKIYLTPNTVTIHHFAASWHSPMNRLKHRIIRWVKIHTGIRIGRKKN